MAIEIKQNKEKKTKSWINDINLFLQKDITLFGKSFSDKKKEKMYSSIYTLLNAKIDIAAVFEILIEEQETPKERKIYEGIYSFLVAGNSLSEAFQKTNQFTEYEYYSIKIGEETAHLTSVFNELQKFYSQKIEQKRKLIGALSYPIVVLIVAGVVVVFMLGVIVPMFADVLSRFGGELPWLTQQIMASSTFIKTHGFLLLLISLFVLFLYFYYSKKESFKAKRDFVALKIPIIGDLWHRVFLSRYAKAMNLLIHSNVPLIESLGLIEKMIAFYPLKKASKSLKKNIIKGKTLYEAMESESIFPAKMKSLIKVGEEVNQLDIMFQQLSEQLDKEINYKIQLFNSILEPLLIILLAIIVGVILVAMYLPIFKLSTEIL